MEAVSRSLCIDTGIRAIPIRMSVVLETPHLPVIKCYSANIAFRIPLACHFARAARRGVIWSRSDVSACAFNLVCTFPNSLLYRVSRVIIIFSYRFPLLRYLLLICYQLNYTNGFPQIDSAVFKIISLLLHYVCFAQRSVHCN